MEQPVQHQECYNPKTGVGQLPPSSRPIFSQGCKVQLLTIETDEIGCMDHYTHEAYVALKHVAPQSKASV